MYDHDFIFLQKNRSYIVFTQILKKVVIFTENQWRHSINTVTALFSIKVTVIYCIIIK